MCATSLDVEMQPAVNKKQNETKHTLVLAGSRTPSFPSQLDSASGIGNVTLYT
jgi:hypothetical protein